MVSRSPPCSECPQQRSKRVLAFAAHERIDGGGVIGVGREARIVAARDDVRARREAAEESGHGTRGGALERHDRQPDDVGLALADQPLDRGSDTALDQHQIRDRHLVMRIDVASERRERAVGHSDGHWRHVLERVGHRQEKHPHAAKLTMIRRPLREAELSETAQQYIARITGFVGDQDPAILLAEAPDRLRTLVERAPASALTWKPTPQAWSIAEIAAHLADAEIVGAWRIRSVLAQDNVPLQAFDQNAWASAFRYGDAPAADSVALFGVLRQATLRLLRTVDPARHQHAGLHAERGRESIQHLMRLYAGHDLNHLAQIERLLAEAR